MATNLAKARCIGKPCCAVIASKASVGRVTANRPFTSAYLALRRSHKSTQFVQAVAVDAEDDVEQEDEVDFDDLGTDDGPGLTTEQVHSMMDMVCNETDIAELELRMGSFNLFVRRKVEGQGQTIYTAQPVAAAAPTSPTVGGSLSSFDLPASDMREYEQQHGTNGAGAASSVDEGDSQNESLVYVASPKVGILRRGRYVKGKKIGKGPLVSEGDQVKKGQTLGFVEQLGTFVPVEAPQAGEIADFLVDEGAPVEYNEEVIAIAPFFGGHIVGDAKWA
jgi:biotin carboxyl carrier protein